jgi:hypothetical protein
MTGPETRHGSKVADRGTAASAIWSGGGRDTDVAATVISPDTTTLNSSAVIQVADLDAS